LLKENVPIGFLKLLVAKRERRSILSVDHASFRTPALAASFDRIALSQGKTPPASNPVERVWNEKI
jgi:hypothetical protein